MITTEAKDKILKVLVEELEPSCMVDVNIKSLMQTTDCTKHEVDAILHQMTKEGLIEFEGINSHDSVYIIVKEPAHKRFLRGGYIFEETILLLELTKLEEEIKKLTTKFSKEDLLDLTSICSNFSTLLANVFLKQN